MDDYLVKSIKNFSPKKGLSRTKEQVYFFIKFDGKKYPISFFDEHILEVETSVVPNLRGLVDIYKRDKFFAQGLLVMMESNEYITKYEYKRYTPSKTTQPSDYVFESLCKG
ncbi:MAG: hypothetical protein ACJZ8S_00770 [Paracoccaceae bacterium]|jgi:hypothetical protein|tara:strand:+ start:3257 stop:3589 length:333 start_codon:yes stop_codon:yes gene_type:complete